MIDHLLRSHLEPLVRRRWHLQFWPKLAVCWVAVGVLGLLLRGLFGAGSALPFIAVVVLGIASFIFLFVRQRRVEDDWRWAARQVEAKHPELEGLLLTAAQQEPKGWGVLSYLQHKVVQKAIEHSGRHDWSEAVPQYRVGLAHAAHLIALVFCLIVVWGLRPVPGQAHKTAQEKHGPPGITVLPGDTVLERGSSLVVMARFEGPVPSSVELILGAGAGKTNRVELVRSLADPMFGGSVYEVDSDFSYHLEYAGQKTRDFNVKVFEYPKLEKANADLTYPAYTGQTNKHIEDTRRLSAVEGTRLDLALQLNKPVVSARLIAKGEETNAIALVIESNRPTATLPQFTLAASKTYQLQLVDADGRTNKIPAQFVIDVTKNRRPELKLASPRGDIRPSALEEVTFEGTAWDDFGVQAFGLAYTVAGQETKVVELGRDVPSKQKRNFQFLLPLEDLGVKTDQLISYFVWADDMGPDGQVRRTTGDLFFAEVRPFDEIFRQGEAQTREQQQQQQQREQQQSGEQGGQQNPSGKLAELQKQIISATWKLWRAQEEKGPATSQPAKKSTTRANAPSFINWAQLRQTFSVARNSEFMGQPAPSTANTRSARARSTNAEPTQTDAEVVRDSQQQALQQAEAAKGNAQDPRLTALWETASKEMQAALDKLKASQNDPAKLQEALAAEQAAYQALLKLQEREYSVTRNRQQNRQNSRNQNSRQQQMQQQLDQLDLQQEENRYESERQAQAPQTQERREQLQVQNRLQELARRQQDVNERLKELQTALQEARTEQEREEVRRQLKRLQEEEQQMMADADELQQRMDRAENQSRFSEQRQQLEQARQEMQRAADAAQQSSASQALASGTRAERQLQEMRDQIRRQNASEFETDMRDMRAQARELARREEEIRKDIEALQDPSRRTLSDADQRKEVLDQLAQQKQRLTNLVERATQLSQETEEAEPLASRELYDSLRNFSQDEARSLKQLQEDLVNSGQLTRNVYDKLKDTGERDNAKALEATSEMLRQGMTPQASQAEQRARESINNLRRGVERAAERVVGDDAETLRMAQRQLDQLTQQLEREMAGSGTNGVRQGGSPNSQTNQAQQAQAGSRQGQRGERGQGQQAQANNQNSQQQPGQRGQGRGQGQPEGQQEQAQAGGEEGQPTPGQNQQAGQRGARGQGRGQQPDGQPNGQGQGNPQEQTAMNNAQEPGQGQQGQRGRGTTAARGQGNRGTNPRGTGAPVQEAGRGELAEGLDFLVQGNRTERGAGPITGNEFAPWSDRLREVEEMVDDPRLRNQVATARERARQMRQDFKRDLKKPDWAVVNLQVMKPLVEVRNQIAEELARREPKDKLVPIDRDPVPSKFSELVRRYYEQLGKDK